MAPVTLTFHTVVSCDECRRPVHLTLTHPAERLDDGTLVADVDDRQLLQAVRVHQLQHDR
jgi:hypothetical protein